MTFTSTYSLTNSSNSTSLSLSTGDQRGASSVSLGNGFSAVFYHDVAAGEIVARLVSADGVPGTRIVASSGSIDMSLNLQGHHEPVSVTRLSNGNIVMTWTSNEPTKNVYFRIFDANLNLLLATQNVESVAGTTQRPDVAALAGGGFVIVFEEVVSATDSNLHFRRFNANGSGIDPVQVLLDSSVGIDEAASVAGLVDGGFAIGWHRRDAISGDTDAYHAVRNADGTVRTATTGTDGFGAINRDVEVVARSDGGFSLYYEDSGWGDDTEITATNYGAGGNYQTQFQATNDGSASSDAAAAVSSEGFIFVAQTLSYTSAPFITGSILAPDGSFLGITFSLDGPGESIVPAVTWLDAATLRLTFRNDSTAFGDTGGGVSTRTYNLFRTTVADAANDVIDFSGSAVWNQILGGDGDDVITGGSGNDEIAGGNNNDTLNGGDGDDALIGGNGINILNGGAGTDVLVINASGSSVHGGAGIDYLIVDPGGVVTVAAITGIEAIQFYNGSNLTLTASQAMTGLASNTALGGDGTVTITMDAGVLLSITGFQGGLITPGSAFTINGTAGIDAIKAAHFSNTILGGAGQDQIRGGNAVDTIDGGTERDKIAGWGGADVLTGGAGNDQFRYLFASDSGIGAAADRITDFTIGSDVFDLRLLDSNLVTPGVQNYAFSFIGAAAFTNGGGSQVRYANSGADLLVQMDLDGNGVADMEVILQGLVGQTMTAGDFLFV